MNIPNSLDIYERERGLRAAPGRYELFQDYPFNQGDSWLGGVNFADAQKNALNPLLVGWELNLGSSTSDDNLTGSYDEGLKHARQHTTGIGFRTHESRTVENWGSYNTFGTPDRTFTLKTVWPQVFLPAFDWAIAASPRCRPWGVQLYLFGKDGSLGAGGTLTVRATASGWEGEIGLLGSGAGHSVNITGLDEGSAKFYVRYPGHSDVEEWLCTTWT